MGFTTYQGSHLSEFWDNAPNVQEATDISLGAAETASGTDAQLATGSRITGRVTGPGGGALANATVSVYTKSESGNYWTQGRYWATTSSDGSYEVSRLPAGTYRLGFVAPLGGSHLAEFWDDAATIDAARDIMVGQSATVAGKDAQLGAASKITGKVTGPDGSGLAPRQRRRVHEVSGSGLLEHVGDVGADALRRHVRPRRP